MEYQYIHDSEDVSSAPLVLRAPRPLLLLLNEEPIRTAGLCEGRGLASVYSLQHLLACLVYSGTQKCLLNGE